MFPFFQWAKGWSVCAIGEWHRPMRTSVWIVSQFFCPAFTASACEVTQSSVCSEIRERFGFYTAAQNNRPPIGWENRSHWITPSQLDSDTSWPVRRCFLLIEGAGERERLQPPAVSWTSLLLYKHTRTSAVGRHESAIIDVLCSRNNWRPFFSLCCLLNQASLCS